MEIYNEVSREVLTFLLKREKENIHTLSLELKRAYLQLHNTVKFLETKGLVRTEKQGRERIVTLTEKGKEIANMLKKIEEVSKNV